jgi:hypothetical protein
LASLFLYLADPLSDETPEEEKRNGETLPLTFIIFLRDPTPPFVAFY